MINKNFFNAMSFLVITILLSGFFSAYLSSSASYFPYSNYGLQSTSKAVCQPGQDMIIQISPTGCTPTIVRSDLLEENDVPVLCPLSATKINPLIDIDSIDSISFSGQYSKQVSGVGFYPAKAALGVQNSLNSPVLNNIGYAVVVLKKQTNESSMPEYVTGNLTANIRYNVNNAFGIGNAIFYLPEFASESDWNARKYQYSFWNGKGYLRADDITNDGASISIYTDAGRVSETNLQVGKTSDSIYIPGFECQAGLKLTLQGLNNPDTRAKLRINADVAEVAKGETFLNNKCSVQAIQNNGLVQRVSIRCQEDSGTSTFLLSINPTVTLNVGGEAKEANLGDWLYDSGDKSVYLGYIGMTGNTLDSSNLFVYLFAKPEKKDNLTSEELNSVSSLVGEFSNAKIKPSGIINSISDAMKSAFGLTNRIGRYISLGQQLDVINFGDKSQNFLGKSVSITSFSGAQDAGLDSSVKEQYESAKQDYETIKTQYASEPYSTGDTTYGEEALYNEIVLAFDANQKATASDLCTQFQTNYPNSKKDLTTYCGYALSSRQANGVYVTINKQVKEISFDGIYDPGFDEYGIVVKADTPAGTSYLNLEKNRAVYLGSSGNDYIQLVSIDGDNSSTIQVSVNVPSSTANPSGINSGTAKLVLNTPYNFANGYTFTLTKINIQKLAKVSVTSNINNAGTTASFSFKIGIEKRAISLSPDEIRKQISSLNDDINKWQDVSDTVGNVSQGLKTACLAAGVALVTKNFILNTGGAGIARTTIMSGTGGWTDKCTNMISAGTYSSLDECYLKNADKIDNDVTTLSKTIEQQNARIKRLETAASTSGLFGEQAVNTKEYMNQNIPQVNSYLDQNLPSSIADPSGKGQLINTDNLLTNVITTQGYSDGVYTSDQLNDIELWTRVLNDPSSSSDLKSLANSRLYSDLLNLQTNAGNYAKITTAASSLGIAPSQVSSLNTQENSKAFAYQGLTDSSNKPIAYVQTLPDGKLYKVVLDDSKGTSNLPIAFDGTNLAVYDASTGQLADKNVMNQFSKIYFQKFDSTSYKNPYKNAKVQYYETDPYKGMPAIVPFDLANGWYAATKPIVSNTATNTYQANGRVNSFYVCNVGANGMQEFLSGGDDVCEMINTGTGQAYNQFPGLSTSDATSTINKANQAIEQASKDYSSGVSKVTILGNKIDVGTPAVNVPQFQCQDFMSPKDCLLLFNLCDPVICPSSRCDLGGAYPVKDVVQSGVIGSIALCLPNVREGIVLPVCLTGIQAGIDGFVSIEKSYRDCLNESLTTGKTVGICDELYSIYVCEFFWKQAIPLANIAIPSVIGMLLGQNVRGGGEYLGVANAWTTAQQSFNYFINSYGANSRDAFNKRTSDVIQDEVCKLYTSAVVPSGADLLDAMTQPDSPPQFTGHFEEITFSTATVPPTSQYKVYYHIYSGKDSGAYYQVYLKGDASMSYYKDTATTIMVDSGYVAVGSQVDQTKDILATSGYKNLCINVNGQEECGFTVTSTNFALNSLADMYASNQANETGIKTTEQCISDYSTGIIRICATSDPGQGTDPNSGTSNARWQQVGYCDVQNMKCWIDTESIQNAIKSTTVANATINSLSSSYLDTLINQSGYLTADGFSSVLNEVESEDNSATKITIIDSVIGKVFLSNQRAALLLIRGDAYADIFRTLFSRLPKPAAPEITTTTKPTQTGSSQEITNLPETGTNSVAYNIWKTAKAFADAGFDELRPAYTTCSYTSTDCSVCPKYDCVCTRFVLRVMIAAGVTTPSIIDSNVKPGVTDPKNILKDTWTSLENMNDLIPIFLNSGDFVEVKDFTKLQKGDLIMLGYHPSNTNTQHIVIFDSYSSDGKSIKAYGDPGKPPLTTLLGANNNKVQLETRAINSPNGFWIYRVFRYVGTGAGTVSTITNSETNSSTTPSTNEQTQTNTPSSEETITIPTSGVLTMGKKIWASANTLATAGSTDVAARFVSISLINAGVNGIEVSGTVSSTIPSSTPYLASIISGSSYFSEVDPNNLQPGDIALLGNGCTEPFSIGIVNFIPDGNKEVDVYTNLGNGVNVQAVSPVSLGITDVSTTYIYKAYRYTKDIGTGNIQLRAKWSLINAVNKVSTLKGSYTDNKIFVDQLIFDGILTEKECGDVRGTSSFVGALGGAVLQKDMTWLKTLLLSKCANDNACKNSLLR